PPFRTRSKPDTGSVITRLRGVAGRSRQARARRAARGRGRPPSGELDDPHFVDALFSGENDAEAVDRRVHRLAEVQVLGDRLEEEGLLAIAQFLVVRLVGHGEDLVL